MDMLYDRYWMLFSVFLCLQCGLRQVEDGCYLDRSVVEEMRRERFEIGVGVLGIVEMVGIHDDLLQGWVNQRYRNGKKENGLVAG